MKKLYEYKLTHIKRCAYHDDLLDYISNNQKGNVFIHGKSGVGKTTLLNDTLAEVVTNESVQIIYFDVLFDESSAAGNFLETFLIECLLNPREFSESSISQISDECTFLTYLTACDVTKSVMNTFISIIEFTCSFLPFNSDISKILPSKLDSEKEVIEGFRFHDFLKKYFENVFSRKKLIIVIDNIQLLCKNDINILKQILDGLECMKISIYKEQLDETVNDKTIYANSLVNCEYNIIEVLPLRREETKEIMSVNLKNYSLMDTAERGRLVHRFDDEIKGNAYDLSNAIRNYNVKISTGDTITMSTSSSVYNLDLISKQILYIITLLKRGLSDNLLRKTLVNYLGNEIFIEESISKLLKKGYLNTHDYDNGILRLSHEKVLSTMGDFSYEDKQELEDIIPSLIDVMLQESYNGSASFAYLASSIISLIELNSLGRDLYMVYKYISFLYVNYSYTQISNLYLEKMKGDNSNIVLEYFPIAVINMILDSLQKTGLFHEGLTLVNFLNKGGNFELFRAKYLLQQYNYNEAFEILRTQTNSSESTALYLNGLQHLREDKKARELINSILITNSCDMYYYIILRNSAHLFLPKEAIQNLRKCVKFFPKESFYQATSFNNLGVAELYAGNYLRAKNSFCVARDYFEKLNSNEIYQSYFNLSTYYLLTFDFESGLAYMKLGFKSIPKSLKYDILKFRNNLLITTYYLDENKDKYQLLKRFLKLWDDIQEVRIDDPNLRYLVAQNILKLDTSYLHIVKDCIDNYPGRRGIYNINMNDDLGLILSISPHWRF